MKGLTLYRPWDVCFPAKDIENRPQKPWNSIIGERIALHAGHHYDYTSLDFIKRTLGIDSIPSTPAGVIFATTRVVGWITIEHDPKEGIIIKKTSDMHPAALQRACMSRWLMGPVCWVLEDTVRLAKPVTCRGAQGLWPLPELVVERVRELEQEARRS